MVRYHYSESLMLLLSYWIVLCQWFDPSINICLHIIILAGFMPSRHDHIQTSDHGCFYLGFGRTARRLHHRGTLRSRLLFHCHFLHITLSVSLHLPQWHSFQRFRAKLMQCLVHAGGESAVLGVPPAVLRVDWRVVRHDHGANPRDGAADRPTTEKSQYIKSLITTACSILLYLNLSLGQVPAHPKLKFIKKWSTLQFSIQCWGSDTLKSLMLLQTLKKPAKAGNKHEGKRKTLKDEIAVVGNCT